LFTGLQGAAGEPSDQGKGDQGRAGAAGGQVSYTSEAKYLLFFAFLLNFVYPIPAECVDEYDIVTSFLCLICACATEDDYVAALVRLCALLKPGGTIVLYSIEWKPSAPTPASYPVGSQKFFDLLLSREFVSKSLEQAGFSDVNVLPLTDRGLQDQFPEISAFSFYTARKIQLVR